MKDLGPTPQHPRRTVLAMAPRPEIRSNLVEHRDRSAGLVRAR